MGIDRFGSRYLERIAQAEENARLREEEAARPKTLEELTTLRAEDIDISERTAAALAKGLAKQLEFAKMQTRRSKRKQAPGNDAWFEAAPISQNERRSFGAEVAYNLEQHAYRVHVTSQLQGAPTVLEGHFVITGEALAKHSRVEFEYKAWLNSIAQFVYGGHARPPHSRLAGGDSPHTFESLDLVDQCEANYEREIDPSEAIASIKRAFED